MGKTEMDATMKKLTQLEKTAEFAVYPAAEPAWLKAKIGSRNYTKIDIAYTRLLRRIAESYCNVDVEDTPDGSCTDECSFTKMCPFGNEGYYYIDNFLRKEMPPTAGGSIFSWAHSLLREALKPTLLLPNYDNPSSDKKKAEKITEMIVAFIGEMHP
jgi:hypothetical protein